MSRVHCVLFTWAGRVHLDFSSSGVVGKVGVVPWVFGGDWACSVNSGLGLVKYILSGIKLLSREGVI